MPADAAENVSELVLPKKRVNARDVFGLDIDMEVPAFDETSQHVPEIERGKGKGCRSAVPRAGRGAEVALR